MLNARLKHAHPIAKNINLAEASMNDTMRHIGSLLVSIADARADKAARFDLGAGLDAAQRISMAATNVTQGLRDMVEGHKALALDRDEANLPTVAFGATPCPTMEVAVDNGEQRHSSLRVVKA